MMVIAYYVIDWNTPIGIQFTAIALFSLIASLALFEVCRRFLPTRILLGIKLPKTKKELVQKKALRNK